MEALEVAGLAMRRKKEGDRSYPITVRIDPDTPPGQIYEKYRALGYSPRRTVEFGLLALEGEPKPVYTANDQTLSALSTIAEHLSTIERTLSNIQITGIVTPAQREIIDTALGNDFIQNVKRLVKPGFTAKPLTD